DDVADVDGVVFLSEDLDQGACDRGWDLGVDLVGGDLEQWLVDLDLVADGLQPLGDGALGDGLAELRHGDVLALARALGGGVVRRLIGRGLLGCIIGGGVLNVLVLGLLRLISLRLFLLGRLAGAVAAACADGAGVGSVVVPSEDRGAGSSGRGWDGGGDGAGRGRGPRRGQVSSEASSEWASSDASSEEESSEESSASSSELSAASSSSEESSPSSSEEGASSSSPISAMTEPTSMVSSSSAITFSRTPATGEGISVSTLSVDTSSKGSSTSTLSPTFFSHWVMVPSVTDSPNSGIST